jgi:hypothetical protein
MPETFKVRKSIIHGNAAYVPDHADIESLAYTLDQDIDEETARRNLFEVFKEPFPGRFTLDVDIDEAKQSAFAKIDRRSRELINAGFTFDGIKFSMSLEAQARYLDMKYGADELPYPLPINSLDDSEMLVLENPVQTRAFCTAARNHLLMVVGSGTLQKDYIRNHVTDWRVAVAYEDPRPPLDAPPPAPPSFELPTPESAPSGDESAPTPPEPPAPPESDEPEETP